MLGKFICYKKKQKQANQKRSKQKKDVLIDRALGVQWLVQTTKCLGVVNIKSKKKKLKTKMLP